MTYFTSQAADAIMAVFAVRYHIENNVNQENIVVQPHWYENYKPIPLYSLI